MEAARVVGGAAVWVLTAAGLAGLVRHASPNTGADLVLWQFGACAALVAAVMSMPGEREA